MATITELPSCEPSTSQEDFPSNESRDDAIDKCLHVLRKAKSDTEMFAALLLVTKLTQAKNTDTASRRKIFDAMGFTFLNRLLKTETVPDGCDSSMYQSLVITLLDCYSTDPELVIHPQMLNKIPVLNDIILDARTSAENINNNSKTADAYQILLAMANQDVGRKQMIEHGTVPILCDICRNLHLGYQKAFNILELLLYYSGEEIWQANSECLNLLICNMASQFKQFQDERKFELCTYLTSCLASSYEWVSKTHAVWPWEIHQGLSDILRSKLGQDQRNPAIKLASLMVYQLGVTWALGPNGEDKVLVLLLINLACVEVRMGLEDCCENPTNADVLPACYSILETCIEYMTCSPTMSLDQKQVLQLHNAMTGAFGAVLFFLKEHQFTPEKVDDPFIRATVRVLSVWLAEETSALKSQVYEVLPFVLSVVEKSFEDVQKMSESSNKPSRTALSPYPLSSSSAASVDLLRLFLPALCHLTAEQEGRDLMLAQGVMETCGKYFSYHWKQFVENKGEEPEVALITLCNIFLNVSLQDADAVRGAEVFVELYGLIVNVLPTLAKQLQNLVLFFNMAVLGLSLLKNLSNLPSVQEPSQNRRYISSVIEQFDNSHQCGKSGQCEVTPTHRQHWEDITELWMLGMQLLIECVPVFPWLPNLFLQCGWINSTVNLLQNVQGGGIDEETSSMYSALLCTLGHHSSDVHSQLTKVNGLKLARKHNMLDLTVVLQTIPSENSR